MKIKDKIISSSEIVGEPAFEESQSILNGVTNG
jgi:hypothetical protein